MAKKTAFGYSGKCYVVDGTQDSILRDDTAEYTTLKEKVRRPKVDKPTATDDDDTSNTNTTAEESKKIETMAKVIPAEKGLRIKRAAETKKPDLDHNLYIALLPEKKSAEKSTKLDDAKQIIRRRKRASKKPVDWSDVVPRNASGESSSDHGDTQTDITDDSNPPIAKLPMIPKELEKELSDKERRRAENKRSREEIERIAAEIEVAVEAAAKVIVKPVVEVTQATHVGWKGACNTCYNASVEFHKVCPEYIKFYAKEVGDFSKAAFEFYCTPTNGLLLAAVIPLGYMSMYRHTLGITSRLMLWMLTFALSAGAYWTGRKDNYKDDYNVLAEYTVVAKEIGRDFLSWMTETFRMPETSEELVMWIFHAFLVFLSFFFVFMMIMGVFAFGSLQ